MIKTMTLGIKERLLMPLMFPEKGTKKDMTVAKTISKKIEIPKDERERIGFSVVQDGNKSGAQWQSEKEVALDLELNDDEREFLKRQVHRVDEDENFTMDLLALAERIELL